MSNSLACLQLLALLMLMSCVRSGPFVQDYEAVEKSCPLQRELSVLSFNIRYQNDRDGVNNWSERQELVTNFLATSKMDIICLQEVLYPQLKTIQTALLEYEVHGVGRDDGFRSGEMVPVLYRKERFSALSSGHFWLSEKPEQAATVAWGANLPRMVSWLRLVDYASINKQEILVLNTHFDHSSPEARQRSALLLSQRITKMAEGAQVIVCGDFNQDSQSDLRTVLCEKTQPQLYDVHQAFYHGSIKGTFHGFKGVAKEGSIDWILHSKGLTGIKAEIHDHDAQSLYLSDHFPISAQFVYSE